MTTRAGRARPMLAAILLAAALTTADATPVTAMDAAPQVTHAEYAAVHEQMPKGRVLRIVGSPGVVTERLEQCQARRYRGWGHRRVVLVFTRQPLAGGRWRLWVKVADARPSATWCTS